MPSSLFQYLDFLKKHDLHGVVSATPDVAYQEIKSKLSPEQIAEFDALAGDAVTWMYRIHTLCAKHAPQLVSSDTAGSSDFEYVTKSDLGMEFLDTWKKILLQAHKKDPMNTSSPLAFNEWLRRNLSTADYAVFSLHTNALDAETFHRWVMTVANSATVPKELN